MKLFYLITLFFVNSALSTFHPITTQIEKIEKQHDNCEIVKQAVIAGGSFIGGLTMLNSHQNSNVQNGIAGALGINFLYNFVPIIRAYKDTGLPQHMITSSNLIRAAHQRILKSTLVNATIRSAVPAVLGVIPLLQAQCYEEDVTMHNFRLGLATGAFLIAATNGVASVLIYKETFEELDEIETNKKY